MVRHSYIFRYLVCVKKKKSQYVYPKKYAEYHFCLVILPRHQFQKTNVFKKGTITVLFVCTHQKRGIQIGKLPLKHQYRVFLIKNFSLQDTDRKRLYRFIDNAVLNQVVCLIYSHNNMNYLPHVCEYRVRSCTRRRGTQNKHFNNCITYLPIRFDWDRTYAVIIILYRQSVIQINYET